MRHRQRIDFGHFGHGVQARSFCLLDRQLLSGIGALVGPTSPAGRPVVCLGITTDRLVGRTLLSRLCLFRALTSLGRLRLCLKFSLGLSDPLQLTGTGLRFLVQLIALLAVAVLAVLLGVGQFGLAEQGSHLALQLPLTLEHPLVAHGLVLAGVGPEFGAIQRYMSQAHQPCLLTDLEHLDEQRGPGIQVTAPEIGDPAVVWLLVTSQDPEGGVLPAGLLDLPGAGQSNAVGVQEQHHHHSRVVRLLTTGILLAVVGADLT